jgi:hypothetical protein
VAGVPTYTMPGELAINKVLAGELPEPAFPEGLRESAPPRWLHLSRGALKSARQHDRNGDPIPRDANLAVAVLGLAHAKCCKEGVWVLNEKRLVARAGLSLSASLSCDEVAPAVASEG